MDDSLLVLPNISLSSEDLPSASILTFNKQDFFVQDTKNFAAALSN